MKKCVALTVVVCAMGLALPFLLPTISAQTPNPSRVIPTWPVNCSLEAKGEYSRGAVLLNSGLRYVCANVRSKEWQPIGVTWVRVELLGNDLVLSGGSAPGLCERSRAKPGSAASSLVHEPEPSRRDA